MEFASIDENKKVLGENGIIKVILGVLRAASLSIACKAAITTTNIHGLREMLDENIYSTLMDVALNDDFDWDHRHKALSAFRALTDIQGLAKSLDSAVVIGDGTVRILQSTEKPFVPMTAVSILFNSTK
jgi:hypothetical protein